MTYLIGTFSTGINILFGRSILICDLLCNKGKICFTIPPINEIAVIHPDKFLSYYINWLKLEIAKFCFSVLLDSLLLNKNPISFIKRRPSTKI